MVDKFGNKYAKMSVIARDFRYAILGFYLNVVGYKAISAGSMVCDASSYFI
jgi:hypothetical protein